MTILSPNTSYSSPYSPVMAIKDLLLLRRLSSLIRRLKLLLSLKGNKGILYSLVASLQRPRHQLRFERQPSLLDCSTSSDLEDFSDACSSFGGTSPIVNIVSRTYCSPRIAAGSATPEDVDKRAEIFIANFHRHFRLERQLSLQLGLSDGKPSAGGSPWPSPISPSSYFYFMPKVITSVSSLARPPPPFSTAIKIITPRPTSSSIKYPDPVPPLKKGRPTVMIHNRPACYNR